MTGFSDGTSESTLKSYFESEEKSGGGTVTCIKVNYSDCTCLVYFGERTGDYKYETYFGDYKYETYFYYISAFLQWL